MKIIKFKVNDNVHNYLKKESEEAELPLSKIAFFYFKNGMNNYKEIKMGIKNYGKSTS